MDQEQLKQLESTDEIKNELVKQFTKHIEEPEIYDESVVKVKLVILGPTRAGKTSWVTRLIDESFNSNEEPTIGAKYSTQEIAIDEKVYHFDMWDVSGEEWCRSLCPMYLQHAHAAIVCYDPSEMESYEEAKEWVQYVQKQGDKGMIISLVGMKSDLHEIAELPVKEEEVESFFIDEQKQEEMFFFPAVSAKTGENVEDVILTIAEAFHERGVRQARESVINPDEEFEKMVGSAVEHKDVLTRKEPLSPNEERMGKAKEKIFDVSSFMKIKFGQCFTYTSKQSKKAYGITKDKSMRVAKSINRGSKHAIGSTRKLLRREKKPGEENKVEPVPMIQEVEIKEDEV